MTQKIIVHNGRHHTDDVLAYVLLRTLHPDHQLIRTRDLSVIETHRDAIVCDVGMIYDPKASRFDHHQQDRATRPVTVEGTEHQVPYSASSLVWKHFGHEYLAKMFPEKGEAERGMIHRLVDTQALAWHDAHDNRAPESLVSELAERQEAEAPMFGRAFFKKIELYRPTYLELPSPGALDFQEGHRPADTAALDREDAGFRQSADVLQPLFEEIVHTASSSVDRYLAGREATPQRVQAFEKKIGAPLSDKERIQLDFAPVVENLHAATRDRQQEVWASNMRDAQGHPRESLVAAHDTIRSLDELAQDPAWKKTFTGLEKLDPAVLKQIGFSHQNYYAPLHDLPSARIRGTDDKMALIIAPSTEGGFSIIPLNARGGLRFPAAWGGLEKDALRKEIGKGIEANFVHNSGFIASSSDFRSALLMSVKAVEKGEKGTEASAEVQALQHHNPNASHEPVAPLPSAAQFADPDFDIAREQQILAEAAAERERQRAEAERLKQERVTARLEAREERDRLARQKRQERAERRAAKEAEAQAKAKQPAPLPVAARSKNASSAAETLRENNPDFSASRSRAKSSGKTHPQGIFPSLSLDNMLPA
ncbi:MAG: MYG1 family protein [Verrucomicrobium sp.]|nr:MYG1 family protein [Verrucomicrobium sp.]